jgi:hypothetical protein
MKKFILLLLFFVAKNISSQNGWTSYTTSAPTGSITNLETAIYVDNAGNKWVGFASGIANSAVIAKYDNSNNWTFWGRGDIGITTSTTSSYVKDFAEDNVGNLWIGTFGGLIKFDGISFTRYTTANGLPNDRINCLEFKNNMLWIGTNDGLSRWDGTAFTNYTMSNSLFPTNLISDLQVESPTTLWMVSGIYLVKFNINSTYTSSSFTTSSTTPTTSLFKIYIDGAGDKWINYANGVMKYNTSGFQYFNNLYPNFTGAFITPGANFIKGPNNGVLTTASSGGQGCLVELLPSGNFKIYYTPNKKLTSFLTSGPMGITYITGTTTSTPLYVSEIHSFDYSKYSIYKVFGLGEGGGVNGDNFKFLDINQVKAGIMNRGDMWWDIGGSGNSYYEVPKIADPLAAANAGFAASLWIGGLDASNQLHTAAQTYRQAGNDFWPGPLDTTNASIDTAAVVNYDKIWKVSTDDINTFLYQKSLGNVPMSYTPTIDMVTWPAHGTGNKSRYLAPFVDVNGDGVYDWKQGDYPKIKGDQTLYYIFNDNFASHGETDGLPFGVEVHAMAYAYGCPSVLNGRTELAYTTFYDYNIINRSNNNYHDVYIGFWSDVDLGYYGDDYIGSSVEDNLGFCYNSDGYDQSVSGPPAYGSFPPAVGTTILKGPIADANDGIDNDLDGVTDELGEEWGMTVFDYYNNNISSFPPQTTNPVNKYHYYNYLSGKWKDSTDFTCGGTGYGGTTPTKYVYQQNYTGLPCNTWTELTAPNMAGDRRYIVGTGPVTLFAKQSIEVEYAQVWSVDSFATSNINLASVNKLISDTRKVRSYYQAGGKSCVGVNIGINEKEIKDAFTIYPNPANSVLYIRSEDGLGKSNIKITDILGKAILETKNENLYNASINIEQLNSGVYFISITSEKGQSVKKFVKQ